MVTAPLNCIQAFVKQSTFFPDRIPEFGYYGHFGQAQGFCSSPMRCSFAATYQVDLNPIDMDLDRYIVFEWTRISNMEQRQPQLTVPHSCPNTPNPANTQSTLSPSSPLAPSPPSSSRKTCATTLPRLIHKLCPPQTIPATNIPKFNPIVRAVRTKLALSLIA